jgi:ADP-heptose:LPS heptosyltransferase
LNRPAKTVLVHLASGIGNIVFATPLLIALGEMDFETDVWLEADYPATAELLLNWTVIRAVHHTAMQCNYPYDYVIPAIPPFYWPKFRRSYGFAKNIVRRPPDQHFYEDEQDYYLEFARAIGYPSALRPYYSLPIAPADHFDVDPSTLVLAPGCKTGQMALKRWPFFPELAERFDDVVLVGTADDLQDAQGRPFRFPSQVRSYVDRLSLRESAEMMAAAGAVVGNDSGLWHIAGAIGTPTLILFGPTPHQTLGQFTRNVRILRAGLECEPCWFAKRFQACSRRIDCLTHLSVELIEDELRMLQGPAR